MTASTQTLHVTVTRAHKISERLKTYAKEVQSELERQSHHLSVSSHQIAATTSQTSRFESQTQSLMCQLALHARLCSAWALVRDAIAVHNHQHHISQRLSQQESYQKHLNLLKSIQTHARRESNDLLLSDLSALSTDSQSSQWASFSVNLFNDSQREHLHSEVRRIEREIVRISDEIAELNAARITLTLDEDLVALIQ